METKPHTSGDFERIEPTLDVKAFDTEAASAKIFTQVIAYKESTYNFKSLSIGDPSRQFSRYKLQKQQLELFDEAGAVAPMAMTQEKFDISDKGWRKNIEDPQLVEDIAEDAKIQKKILEAETPLHRRDALALIRERDERLKRERDERVNKWAMPKTESETEKPAFLKDSIDKIRERDARLKMEHPAQTGTAVEAVPPSKEVSTKKLEGAVERSGEKMEKIEEKLLKRREASQERLKQEGLTNIEKGVKYMNAMSPRTKFLIAIGFAGAAVATGGATAVLSKIFSAGTFATGLYEKEVAQKQKDGEPVKKGRIALKSLLIGTVLALGTSQLISLAADAAAPIVSDTIDKIKEFFAGNPEAAAVPETAVVPETGPTPPPFELLALPDYTIEPGDNLTKVTMEKVIPNIPGTDEMTPFQKENMIQNMLKYAAAHPFDPDFATINQFANPDLIKPGDTLDLNQIRDALNKFSYASHGGETLLGHAGKL